MYVKNHLVQSYFNDLHQKKKVGGITLLDILFRWKQSRVYVPEGKLRTTVMQEVHDVPMAGHCGEKSTREFLGKIFYWLEMKEDENHYIRTCIKCQSTKLVHKKNFELYKPFPIPSSPFETVPMDFMTCLSEWEGMDATMWW